MPENMIGGDVVKNIGRVRIIVKVLIVATIVLAFGSFALADDYVPLPGIKARQKLTLAEKECQLSGMSYAFLMKTGFPTPKKLSTA